MAKYTELFSEYVANGRELPAVFTQIENFEELFLMRFGDCEIGFETEDIFTLKLELKANTIIPDYKKRIEALKNALPVKVRTLTAVVGAREASNTNLPINSASALPSSVERANSYTDTNTEHTEGFTPDEFIKYDEYLKKSNILIEDCLEKFESLFMKVY